jgi:hypothetical protein
VIARLIVCLLLALPINCLMLTPLGCSAAGPILAALGAGAQWLGSALDVAEAGKDAFFARHPSMDRQAEVATALTRARQALAVLDGALAASEAGERQDVDAARREALAAYRELHALLEALGVLDGVCRDCGGVEGNAPEPGPVPLPAPAVVAQRMGG